MKISTYIARFFQHNQIDCVFEMAGGMITQILDEIHLLNATQIVSMHHEQAAAFAAEAYARASGKVGVALATSGPGATNLVTGIASCYFDSTPVIFLTGQVNTHELKGRKNIRQLGFQETDIVGMTQQITKHSFQINKKNVRQFPALLEAAYRLAMSGRPGPVLIDIPMDMQRVEVASEFIKFSADTPKCLSSNRLSSSQSKNKFQKSMKQFSHLVEVIKAAQNPLILAGGGIKSARVSALFRQLVNRLQIPVVSSLMAIDALSYVHPLRVGFIGSYGNRWANLALGTCDVLIVLGSRLDIRQTGADANAFEFNKTIIHVDCEEGEINNRLKNCVPIQMLLQNFIPEFLYYLYTHKLPSFFKWRMHLKLLQNIYPDVSELNNIKGIHPNQFMHLLAKQATDSIGYVVDVGNHQMWAAQSLELGDKQFFMTSGGMGAMGFALPAAIGAALAEPLKPIVVIIGDGCMQLNIQELQTIVRNKIPIKIIVLNNQSLGMIRQFQDNYFEGRYQSTYWGYSAPDFTAVARAYQIKAETILTHRDIESKLTWLWKEPREPALLQVMIDSQTNVYPKIAFGKPITEMEPQAKPISMEST